MHSRGQRREDRRAKIRQAWEEHYEDLVQGQITLGEILGYDDERLMKLAAKGLRLFKVGKLDGALRVFRGLVVLDPWVPYFHYLLGSVHEKVGDLDRAVHEYARVVEQTGELDPAPDILAFALLGRGRVLARQGQGVSALEDLRRVLGGGVSCSDPALATAAQLICQHLERGGG